MSRPDNELELIRARVEGVADAGDVDDGLLADYDLVHRLTAPLDAVPEMPDLRCPRPAPRPRRVNWLAAAAVLIGVAVGTAVLLRAPDLSGMPVVASAPELVVPPPADVRLAHVPLEQVEPEGKVLPLATGLDRYSAVVDGKVHWLQNSKTANAIAALSERPLIALFYHPKDKERIHAVLYGPFADKRVVAQVARGIPLLYAIKKDAMLRAGPQVTVYSDGKPVKAWYGSKLAPCSLHEGLQQVLDELPKGVSLSTLARAIGELTEGAAALKAENWAGAWTRYQAAAGLRTRYVVNASWGIARVRNAARDALLAARDAGTREEIRAALVAAKARFAGTPFMADFDAVIVAVDQRGRFPTLQGQ